MKQMEGENKNMSERYCKKKKRNKGSALPGVSGQQGVFLQVVCVCVCLRECWR